MHQDLRYLVSHTWAVKVGSAPDYQCMSKMQLALPSRIAGRFESHNWYLQSICLSPNSATFSGLILSSHPSPSEISLSLLRFSRPIHTHSTLAMTTANNRYPMVMMCGLRYWWPEKDGRYRRTPVTAPRSPMQICMATPVARLVCPDIFSDGQLVRRLQRERA